MSVDAKHPDYVERADDWRLVRDFERGPPAVKDAGEVYLPKPSGFNAQKDGGAAMYDAYRKRARVLHVLAPTRDGMVGLIHRAEFKVDGIDEGSELEAIWENATLDGLPLEAFAQRVTGELLLTGRYGVLVDVAAEDARDTREGLPYLAGYAAETIINWSEEGDLYVLDETGWQRTAGDEFSWKNVQKYRVLRLEDGEYTQQEYAPPEEQAVGAQPVNRPAAEEERDDGAGEKVVPVRRGEGAGGLNQIPFVVAGPRDLSLTPEEPPLIGVARAALAAYQLDADYRFQLYMTGQETLVFSGMVKEQAPVQIGAGVIVTIEAPEGKAAYVSPTGKGIEAHKSAIDDCKKDALMAGAALFDTTDTPDESGKARKMRYAAQTATLSTVAQASAKLIERALRYAAMFLGVADDKIEEIVVTPNKEFVEIEMEPAAALQLMQVWQGGGISYQTYYDNLQRGGIASEERDAQEEQELIDQEAPDEALAGGDLGEGDLAAGERFIETGEGLGTDEDVADLFAPDLLEEVA